MKGLKTTTMVAAVVALLMSSCGKNGAGSSSGIFDEVSSLVEKEKADKEKFKEKAKKCEDMDCLVKMQKEGREYEEKYEKLFAKTEEKLKGKEVKVELENGLPLRVSKPFAIKSVSSGGTIEFPGELEVTEQLKCTNKYRPLVDWDIQLEYVGKDGKVLETSKVYFFTLMEGTDAGGEKVIPAGTKNKVLASAGIGRDPEKWKDFEKIVVKKIDGNK